MPRTVVLIRHAETQANAALRWQGTSSSDFTATGADQISRLAERTEPWTFDRLIASDLDRTMRTARAAGTPEPDPRWREFDVGAWEGLTSDEVRVQFPGELEALIAGEDLQLGGGERLSDFHERVVDAFDTLSDELDDGEEAVVVTHGGAIWSVLSHLIGAPGRSAAIIPSHNTAITRITIADDGEASIWVFNDAAHLDSLPTQFGPEGRVVTLVRHGQTEGNVTGRWQGRSDSPLTEHGQWQAETAAAAIPPVQSWYSSPAGRTLHTARILATGSDVDPSTHDGLLEMSFGAWENLTSAEALAADPEWFDAIYGRGEDLPRGRDGESFEQAAERFHLAIEELASTTDHSDIGVVSHGAAIRAYVTRITGVPFGGRGRFPVPRNTSMSRIVYANGAPVLGSYNVAPHLD